jgi:hypothetical protein
MFCSVYELARLSLAVYQRTPADIAPWRMRLEFPRPNGFYGALYQNSDFYVLAFRGTDEGYDLVPDLAAFAGMVPNQFANAEQALVAARRSIGPRVKLALTGHSLGGGLASLLAAKRGLPAVVFNAPGMSRSFVDSIGLSGVPVFGAFFAWAAAGVNLNWIVNIRANGDVVSLGTGPRLGTVASVPLTGCGLTIDSLSPARTARTAYVPELGTTSSVEAEALAKLSVGAVRAVLCQHTMLKMTQTLKNMAEYRKPLDWFGPTWRGWGHVAR